MSLQADEFLGVMTYDPVDVFGPQPTPEKHPHVDVFGPQ